MNNKKTVIISISICVVIGFLLLNNLIINPTKKGTGDNSNKPVSLVVAPPNCPVITGTIGSESTSNSDQPILTNFKPISSTVKIKDKEYKISPDGIGFYPPINIEPEATVHVQLDLNPDEPVGILVVDGGQLSKNGNSSSEIKADTEGHIDFDFTARKEVGNYRVAIYARNKREFLNFNVPEQVGLTTSNH